MGAHEIHLRKMDDRLAFRLTDAAKTNVLLKDGPMSLSVKNFFPPNFCLQSFYLQTIFLLMVAQQMVAQQTVYLQVFPMMNVHRRIVLKMVFQKMMHVPMTIDLSKVGLQKVYLLTFFLDLMILVYRGVVS